MDVFLTREEIAKKLKVDVSTIDRERTRNPLFPVEYRINNRLVRFREKDVLEYIESMKKNRCIN